MIDSDGDEYFHVQWFSQSLSFLRKIKRETKLRSLRLSHNIYLQK